MFKLRHFVLVFFCLSLLSFIDLKPLSVGHSRSVAGDTSYVIPLLAKYPDRTLLTQVQPPHYILSIGYFPTEAEAAEFKKGLEKDYPGCTVVPYEKKK